MTTVSHRLRQGLQVARQTGREPVRITITMADASALASETGDGVDYGIDGRPTSIDGVPIAVVYGVTTSTITTQTPGQQGQSSASV